MNNAKIFLIGFMGAGKTYMGGKIAEILNLPFYDIDREIEIKAELDVNSIFAEKGEEYFRKMESDILLSWDKNGIISTGAGIVENPENREFLQNKENFTIWLDISWNIIKSRILNSYRPLVLNRTMQELENLFNNRYLLYQNSADYRFQSSSAEELAKTIRENFL